MAKTYTDYSFYAPVVKPKPKPKAPVLPPGFSGQSDADYEAYLTGGGAWGGYSQPSPPSESYVWPGAGEDTSDYGNIDVTEGGAYFDPEQAITGDWEYIAGKKAMEDANRRARTQLETQRRQALIDLGVVPAGDPTAAALGDVDEAARLEAAKNPYSAFAQAGLQKTRALDQLRAALGARGTWRSGSVQGGALDNQRAYEATTNAATSQTLKALGNALGLYTGGVEDRETGLRTIASGVGQRLSQDPRFQPRTVKARWDAARGGFVSPSGGLYDANGTKIG